MISKLKILLHRYSKVKSPSTTTKQKEETTINLQSIDNEMKKNEGNVIETSYSQN